VRSIKKADIKAFYSPERKIRFWRRSTKALPLSNIARPAQPDHRTALFPDDSIKNKN
jgi:hypothetical protein